MKADLILHLAVKLHLQVQCILNLCPFKKQLWLRPSYSVDDGEFDHRLQDYFRDPMPTSTPISSPGLKFGRFYEQPEDERNNDELCTIKPVHYQGKLVANGS